jgi:hypothetical protein
LLLYEAGFQVFLENGGEHDILASGNPKKLSIRQGVGGIDRV